MISICELVTFTHAEEKTSVLEPDGCESVAI